MPQYYTLDEAAKKLGMSSDELRQMAIKKQISAFRDGSSWRFPDKVIDEKARQLGVGSDPELQLGDALASAPIPPPPAKSSGRFPKKDIPLSVDDSDELALGGPKSSKRLPKPAGDSDVRLVMDDAPELRLDSDVRLDSPRPKRGGDSGVRLISPDDTSDSDVKLVGDDGKPASDSDIRLKDLPAPSRKKGPEANIITEEIDLDAEESKIRSRSKGAPPGKSKMAPKGAPNLPGLPTSSPYELSEPDLGLDLPKPKKNSRVVYDNNSEHELVAFDASKSRGGDLGSGEIPLLSDDSDVDLGGLPTPNAGNSGINLDDPGDSGISLESGGSDELEFELSLDAGNTPKPVSGKNLDADSSSEFELSLDEAPSDASDSEFELSLDEDSSVSSGLDMGKLDNSDSEFELTLDDEGSLAVEEEGKDIFEETNFDVPALGDESGSEAVALEDSDTNLESSDFELSLDDSASGSQVVAMDGDDDADEAAATVAKPRKAAAAKSKPKGKASLDEDEPELEFEEIDEKPAAKKSKTKAKAAVIEDDDEVEDSEEEDAPSAAPQAAEWGALPAVLLFPTILVMFVVGLMGYELLQGAWGYHRSTKVARPIIDSIARIFDDTIPKEVQ